MGPFKQYIDGLTNIWNEATGAARIGIVLLAILCLALIGGVGYWSTQPNYVALLSGASPEKTDKVINELDKANIEYMLSGAGGNLLVDKRDYAKARMIARSKGVSDSESSSFPMAGAFGSPSERRNLARIQKQQSLASSIQKLNVVQLADVHLNIPDRGPFERKSSPPSASVLLELLPGSTLSDEQANSIASLVAFAVEDLTPESVQITDKEGRNYTIPDENAQFIGSQVEYTTQLEKRLARKAETQLTHFLGHRNASVQVSLDLTFTNGSKKSTKYDPDGKVASEEDLLTETTMQPKSNAVGPAGTTSNLANNDSTSSSSDIQNKSENIKTSYLVPKTEETVTNTTPILNFMTVSVLVNSKASGVLAEDETLLPDIQQRVEAIVKNAVGFQDKTGSISVELLPFPADEFADTVVAPPFDWTQVNEIIRNASLAIAALCALLIGFLVLKKIKPTQTPKEPIIQLDPDRRQSLEQLAGLVKNNPEVFNELIRNWSGSATENESEPQQEAA